MQRILHVLIPHKENNFYTLYVSGCYGAKTPISDGTDFSFISGSLLVLYYTYPAHRRAYIVRFTENGKTELPGLSEPIHKIICVYASKVDKLKKSLSYIQEHYEFLFSLPDIFFVRLERVIQRKGKLNYDALRSLCEQQKREAL